MENEIEIHTFSLLKLWEIEFSNYGCLHYQKWFINTIYIQQQQQSDTQGYEGIKDFSLIFQLSFASLS